MKVSEILKGKKAWEKEEMLRYQEDLETDVVDKLATDAAKGVRERAVRHKNVSINALWKVVTQKKNVEEEYILRQTFNKLTPELKLKWFKEEYYKILPQSMFHKLDYLPYEKTQKSSIKDEFNELLSNLVTSGEHNHQYAIRWLLREYDVKGDKKLFDYLKNKHSNEIIRYRDKIKLTDKELDDNFENYFAKTGLWFSNPADDLGPDFIEQLSEKQLDYMFSKLDRFPKDNVYYLKQNKNFKPKHTLIILNYDHTFNKDIFYIIEELPLDDKCEKKLIEMFENKGDEHNRKQWEVLESWAKNPTHSKKLFDMMKSWKSGSGWSTEASYNMIKTGNYSEDEIEELYSNRSDYDRVSSYSKLVTNPNYPENKLRELWKDYWHNEWKKGEIEGPGLGGDFKRWNMSSDDATVHKILFNLVTKSKLASEFGMEYYNEIGDEKYLPEEAKDIFLF